MRSSCTTISYYSHQCQLTVPEVTKSYPVSAVTPVSCERGSHCADVSCLKDIQNKGAFHPQRILSHPPLALVSLNLSLCQSPFSPTSISHPSTRLFALVFSFWGGWDVAGESRSRSSEWDNDIDNDSGESKQWQNKSVIWTGIWWDILPWITWYYTV